MAGLKNLFQNITDASQGLLMRRINGAGIGPLKAAFNQGQALKFMQAEALIDTHIFLWLIGGSKRLKEVPWIRDYNVLAISPVSLLEMKFLHEVGKIQMDLPKIISNLADDPRFQIDNPPLESICLKAIDFSWTRDPFDRLLVAHSDFRNLPFGTVDNLIRQNYVNTL